MNRFDRPRQALAVALAGLAGFVDATGYLSAHGYFVSFMSGNTTRLAVDLSENLARAAAPLLLIAGFVLGVFGGALVVARTGERRKPAVLATVTALLVLSAAASSAGLGNAALAAMVLAMGALNNTFQRGGEVAVRVTYMTGALVRLGQGLAARMLGRAGGDWAPHLLLWLGLAGGALLGALAFGRIGGMNHWIAGIWAAALTVAAQRLSPRAAS